MSTKSVDGPNIVRCFQAMQLETQKTDAIILRDSELLIELLPNCDAEALMQQPFNIQANKRWIKMVKTL